jgi:AraC family transcriptional regulator
MLRRGEVFGTAGASLDLSDATLTETRYAAGTRLAVHEHELPMFVLTVEGSFDESFDKHQRTCGPRHLVFRPPGERHSQRFLTRGATCLTIEIPSLADEVSLSKVDGRLNLQGSPTLWALRIYDELKRPGESTALVLEELIANLGSFAGTRAAPPNGGPPSWLNNARELIDARFMEPVRLAEIAREVGVHRVHLSRTFRHFLGCGVAEYVSRVRVHAACARLRTARTRGSAVAAEVGFSDESHMGRTFRKVMSRGPRDYRGVGSTDL